MTVYLLGVSPTFASSPLVVDDVVIVAAAGTLAGYDIATGKMKWRMAAFKLPVATPPSTER